MRHITVHTDIVCDLCETNMETTEAGWMLESPASLGTRRVLLDLCPDCGTRMTVTFEKAQQLKRSGSTKKSTFKRVPDGFSCAICGRPFDSAQGLSMHKRRTHDQTPAERK
jgi:hypothetical protein